MTIKIQGNRVCENDLHVWILVSDTIKGWVDIPFSISTPEFGTLQEMIDYLEEKEGLMIQCIETHIEWNIPFQHPSDMCVDRIDLIPEEE